MDADLLDTDLKVADLALDNGDVSYDVLCELELFERACMFGRFHGLC